MIAIVCDTPYQLMSATLVAGEVAPGEKIVFFINTYLYFREEAFGYSDAHPNIEKVLYYGKKHMGAGKLLFGLANPQAMLKHVDGYEKDMDFSAIICSRTTYLATYLYNEYAKRHPNLPLYLVEEGIGEYTGPVVDTRFTKACRMLKQKTHMDHVARAYFSAPNLYPYRTYFPVEKIPRLAPETQSMIETMFNMGDIRNGGNPLDKYHCIFLTNPSSINMDNAEDARAHDKADSDTIDAVCGGVKGDMIIKLHPMDYDFQKDGVELYRSRLPMESLLFTMDCADKLFVSSLSTAMLTPKLLFDAEPFLISTYRILDVHTRKYMPDAAQRQRYYDFVDGVMAMYADPTRCAVPETLEELRDTAAAFYARATTARS